MAHLLTSLLSIDPFADVLERDLICIECGRSSRPGERGWRSYLDMNDEPATYCPDCARRAFDGDVPDGHDDGPDD